MNGWYAGRGLTSTGTSKAWRNGGTRTLCTSTNKYKVFTPWTPCNRLLRQQLYRKALDGE